MKLDRPLAELRDEAEVILTVAAAHEVGLFRAVAEEPAGADALARRMSLDARATRIVCHALVELGLFEEDAGTYRPTVRCRAELCDPGAEAYVAGGLSHWLSSMRSWTRLDEALLRGGPLEKRPDQRDAARVGRFMSAMAAAPAERVRRIVDLCLARRPDARNALDVGGGPGHMSRAFVERGLAATLLDTTDVIEHVVRHYGLGDVEGLQAVEGDFNEDPLPRGPYDLVLLSNVLHIYGAGRNRALVRKVAEVTNPGGVVAVAEFLRGRSGRAGLFGIRMLLHTDEGDAYSAEEIVGWLEEAGFEDPRVEDVDEDRQLLTAVRSDA